MDKSILHVVLSLTETAEKLAICQFVGRRKLFRRTEYPMIAIHFPRSKTLPNQVGLEEAVVPFQALKRSCTVAAGVISHPLDGQ